MWPPLNRVETEFIGVTRKNGPVLLQNVALTALGLTSLRMVYWGHTKGNGAVLLQNAAPTPLGTHEHSRVHFLILRSGLPLLNRVGAEFIGVTRKERPCFAAERGLDRLGPTSLRMVYWGHTKGTAPFLLQNAAPTPLGTHEHSRVHFLILRSGLPLLNRVGAEIYWSQTKRNGPVLLQNVALTALGPQACGWFIGGTRKERRCFACRMRL